MLYVHMYDEVDTSLCTQYLQVTVPQADAAAVYDGAFQITLFSVDKGDTAKDILIQYHNNTAIAASATLDVTNESWDSNYAEIDFEMRVQNDDTGYWNSFQLPQRVRQRPLCYSQGDRHRLGQHEPVDLWLDGL